MEFSERFLEELAERNDIVDVVGSYVPLTYKAGSYWACCPFHNEKTPSFHVQKDKQLYHCFGCGKGGGVISFIMEIENLSFPDAVVFLARRAGMQLPEDRDEGAGRQRERLLSLNREAARFFYAALTGPNGGPGRDYIQRRGISPGMARSFGLGFAPDSFYALSDALQKKGYTEAELVLAGLCNGNKSGKGVHDVFRGRLMFPVIDVRGNVIGFSGRIVGDGEPKYLNSRETPVFNKSRNLFGLNLAKKSKNGYILLSEGNIDVVSLHQAGFDSAVASLGTSLTAEQARLISRYTGEVIIAYDNDGAGQKAAQRAIGILEGLNLKVRVLQMEGAKDPDEYIRARGAGAFQNLIEASENHVEYRLRSVGKKYDLQNDAEKVAYLQEAAEIVSQLPSPVEREVYAMRLADSSGVSREVLADEVRRVQKRQAGRLRRREERDAPRNLRAGAQPRDRSLRYENERSAMAEEGVVRLLYLDPGLFQGVSLSPEDFSSPLLGRAYRLLRERVDRHEPLSPAALSGLFTPEEESHLTSVLLKPQVLANGKQALADYIGVMESEKLARFAQEDLRAFAESQRNKKGYGG